jgi:hypothetical protein
MSSIGTGYDLSVTTFSPDGRVFQIEYANKAIDNSGTVVGIKCKDGVVLGVEKLIPSKMLLEGSNRRIHAVHKHAGMAVAGLAADGRQIVGRARSEASQYLSFYGEDIPIKELCDRVAHYVHLCTLYWWLRPFGSAAILGGYDRDGPQLYMIEPSGVAYVCSHLQPSPMMLMLSLLFLVLDMGKCGLRSLSFLWQWHTVCDSNLSGIMKYIRVISAAGSYMINAHICHSPLKFLYF